MTEDLKQPELNSEHICLNGLHELEYWKETLDCDELTLRKAVAVVGDAPEKVRAYLVERREGSCG